jgi:hypothetical protein
VQVATVDRRFEWAGVAYWPSRSTSLRTDGHDAQSDARQRCRG